MRLFIQRAPTCPSVCKSSPVRLLQNQLINCINTFHKAFLNAEISLVCSTEGLLPFSKEDTCHVLCPWHRWQQFCGVFLCVCLNDPLTPLKSPWPLTLLTPPMTPWPCHYCIVFKFSLVCVITKSMSPYGQVFDVSSLIDRTFLRLTLYCVCTTPDIKRRLDTVIRCVIWLHRKLT